MKKTFFIIFCFFVFIWSNLNCYSSTFELTIVGNCKIVGSFSKITLLLIELLKNDLSINFIPVDNKTNEQGCENFNVGKKIKTNVSLLTEMLTRNKKNIFERLPENGIKIAYSMLESTQIPKEWVEILNNIFDAVIVPDGYLVDIYKQSGVKIPVFMIPVMINLDQFYKYKSTEEKTIKPFVFGCSAVNYERKNLSLLIKAFSEAYRNNFDYKLKIHTKIPLYIDDLKKNIYESNANNIELIEKNLNEEEYAQFLSSLNCYVLLSKGEGFSITPREALACGVPCIISNNTAHKTICDTGYVYPILSTTEESAYYPAFKKFCGKHFNCNINDVINGFKNVYDNYKLYLDKVDNAKKWLEQYEGKNLKNKYMNLVKPKKILFGNKDEVTNEYLMTSSLTLYKKYLNLVNGGVF